MPRPYSVLALLGALLLAASPLLAGLAGEEVRIPLRTGPVNAVLGPGESLVYSYQYRVEEGVPRTESRSSRLVEWRSFPPKSCESLSLPGVALEKHCTIRVFAVKLVEPQEAGGLVLVVRRPNDTHTLRILRPGEWEAIEILEPQTYTTYILNTGAEPVNITAYYGSGVRETYKPYLPHALATGALGVAMLIASILMLWRARIIMK